MPYRTPAVVMGTVLEPAFEYRGAYAGKSPGGLYEDWAFFEWRIGNGDWKKEDFPLGYRWGSLGGSLF